MLESEIEKRLHAGIKKLGAKELRPLCLKFVSPGFTGVPDRIILLPGGRLVFVELKQPGKTERPRQRLVQGLLRKLGFRVFSAVDSYEKVDEVVDLCRNWLAVYADYQKIGVLLELLDVEEET